MAVAEVSEALRAHYGDYYRGASDWRTAGAADKVSNLLALCGGLGCDTLLEIGAGDGAVLAGLAERGFARRRFGIELSPTALDAARERGVQGGAALVRYDGARLPFADASLDLAVLSHVVEHLEHPRVLLAEAARVARHVFVEVPLEDTWRLPAHYRPDPTGHINAYTLRGIRRLVETCGLEVLAERVSHPTRAAYALRPELGPWRSRAHWAVKQALLAAAPALAQHLFTYHGALLCRARTGDQAPGATRRTSPRSCASSKKST